MALTDKLTAIGDAIRAKTGSSSLIPLSNMPSAIASIPTGIEVLRVTYEQRNSDVARFLDEVTYDATDYSVSQVANYIGTTGKTRPNGAEVTLVGSGTLVLSDLSTGRSQRAAVSSGSYILYNITPNQRGTFTVTDTGGNITDIGVLLSSSGLRMIYADNLINVRDLGGWQCDGGTVKYGKLFRGCELTGSALVYNQITDSGKAVLNDLLHIDYECDLRWDDEVSGADRIIGTSDDIISSALGDSVEYVRFPIYYYVNAVKLDSTYAPLMKRCLTYVMEQVIKGEVGYFHCMYGRDRTGTLACILLALLGVSQSDIDKDYELTNFIGSDSGLTAYRNSDNWKGLIAYFNTFSGSTFCDKVANWAVQMGIPVEMLNAYRTAMIEGTPRTLTPDVSVFSVTNTMSHASGDNTSATAVQYQPYEANIKADAGYLIDNVAVMMNGVDVTDSCFIGTPAYIRHWIEVIDDGHVTLSNRVGSVKTGEGYSTFIRCDTGYEITNVTITMGGINVSGYYSGGAVIIPQVTGNIQITVTTEEVSLLPSAYQEVAYVENTGSAYCDLGFSGKTGLVATGKAQYYASGDVYLLGGTNASSQRWLLGASCYIGSASTSLDQLVSANTDFTFTFDTTAGSAYLEVTSGGNTHRRTIANSTAFDNGVTTALFCRRGSSAYERNMTGRIYSLTVMDGDTEVVNLIPCKRKSDSVAGFYDTVSGSFLTSLSSTAFVAGAEV